MYVLENVTRWEIYRHGVKASEKRMIGDK